MSLVKKIILAGAVGLAAIVSGCGPRNAVDVKAMNREMSRDKRYKESINDLLAEFGDVETVTTQITNVQDGFIPLEHSSRVYKFVRVSGGDAGKGLVLIYPHSKYFEPYVPAKICFKRIKNSKISANELTRRYILEIGSVSSESDYIIEADGIIEPDGVKYIEEKK